MVAETQEEDTVMLDGRKATGGKKGAKGASAKKSKAETSEDSEGTAAERRLQAKLDLVSALLRARWYTR